jgi:arginyl-tRNA synthetase
MAKIAKKRPKEMEKRFTTQLYKYSSVKLNFNNIEFAEPGFIIFFLSKEYLQKQVGEVLKKGEKFGDLKIGRGKKINLEFISANPTGPLTLGNGRGGFAGDVLANVLKKVGYQVCREYYINDRGRQIEGLKKGLYRGEKRTVSQIQKENRKLVEKKLKIRFDLWFSEKSLYKNKEVEKVLAYLKKKNLAYQKDGALWFQSTKFGDDKDRVLIRPDGRKTYFASDIAYLKNKFQRGFDRLIFFWGADHYGYVARIKAAAQALGYKKEKLDFVVCQLVRIMQGERFVKMSKRAGVFITLEELIDQVGLDVARFFFCQRALNSHLNFDLALAKEKSEKNPVYYVQYAYARINSILRKTKNYKLPALPAGGQTTNYKLLNHKSELNLIKQLIRFPEIIEDTAGDYQVQRIPGYAIDLAAALHQFYRDCRVIGQDKELSRVRFALILAVKTTLKNVLDLTGVSAPEKM